LQKLLVAVIAHVENAPVGQVDQSPIVGFDSRAHVEDGYTIFADRQPIASDRAEVSRYSRAGDFAPENIPLIRRPQLTLASAGCPRLTGSGC